MQSRGTKVLRDWIRLEQNEKFMDSMCKNADEAVMTNFLLHYTSHKNFSRRICGLADVKKKLLTLQTVCKREAPVAKNIFSSQFDGNGQQRITLQIILLKGSPQNGILGAVRG
jgi:hypothetical protein